MNTSLRSIRSLPGRHFRPMVLSAAVLGAMLTGCGPQVTPPTPAVPTQVTANGPVPAAPAAVAVAPAAVPVPPAPPPAAYPPVAQQAPVVGRPVPLATEPAYREPPTQWAAQQAAPPARVQRQRVASDAPRQVASDRVGRVSSIEPIRERPSGSGAGGVLGGVLGAVVGNQFGHGTGRAALTVLGGVGGAVAGNNVERNVKERVVAYRINVVLDDGASRTIEESNLDGLRVGDRVRVDGNGVRRI